MDLKEFKKLKSRAQIRNPANDCCAIEMSEGRYSWACNICKTKYVACLYAIKNKTGKQEAWCYEKQNLLNTFTMAPGGIRDLYRGLT